MKFGQLFEFHKIPEWYTEYISYIDLREKIDEFKTLRKQGVVRLLRGYYMIGKRGQIFSIDFIKNYKQGVTVSYRHSRTKSNVTEDDLKQPLVPNNERSNSDQDIRKSDSSVKLDV